MENISLLILRANITLERPVSMLLVSTWSEQMVLKFSKNKVYQLLCELLLSITLDGVVGYHVRL